MTSNAVEFVFIDLVGCSSHILHYAGVCVIIANSYLSSLLISQESSTISLSKYVELWCKRGGFLSLLFECKGWQLCLFSMLEKSLEDAVPSVCSSKYYVVKASRIFE